MNRREVEYRLFPSSQRRGGRDINKCCEASFVGADGVVSSAKCSGLRVFAELTTPSAPLRWLRGILLMAQPPLLCEEGNYARFQFVHTFDERPFFCEPTR